MEKFDAVKKVTVTEQIMDQIAAKITSGELQPGDKLPTERDLAVQLGVTRGRVREALRALSLVGLITIKAGAGSFVAHSEKPLPGETVLWMFHSELHRLDEVYAARKLIESEVYLSARGELTGEQLDKLTADLARYSARFPAGQPEELLDLLDGIDLYVGEHCGNRIYDKLMQTIVHLRRDTSLRLLAIPGAAQNGAASRQRILKALGSGTEAELRRALEQFYASSFRFYQSIGS